MSACGCNEIVESYHNGCKSVVYVNTGLRGPAGPTGPANTFLVEVFTLSAGDITNGFITTANPIVSAEHALVQVAGFPMLIPVEDYTWTLGTSRITFLSHVRARLLAGDKIYVRRLTTA